MAIRRPAEVVLVLECAPGSPPAGGPELLPEVPWNGKHYVIGFADMHVEFSTRERIDKFTWDPDKVRESVP